MGKQTLMIGLFILLFACKQGPTQSSNTTTNYENTDLEETTPLSISNIDNENANPNYDLKQWKLTSLRISKKDFEDLHEQHYKKIEIEKIENFETAKKMLNGIAFWVPKYEPILHKIETRNGKTILVTEYTTQDAEQLVWEAPGFVAYYPALDVLLLEGGHSSSVAYSLTTGDDINIVGEPESSLPSPSGKLRMMSYYTGQYNVSKLQVKEENTYRNVVDIQDIDNGMFSYMMNAFWVGDSTFYFQDEVVDESTGENIYYKLSFLNHN